MGIFLGLGSNLGDREGQLKAAADSLGARGITVWKCASLYSTEPREVLDQPWFLNTIIEVRTLLEPEALLQECLDVERAAGRVRLRDKGPRPIDIDIVLYGDRLVDSPGLIIPHPRYRERRFVLEPLAELAPDVTDPASGLTMLQLRDLCPDPGVVRVVGPPLR